MPENDKVFTIADMNTDYQMLEALFFLRASKWVVLK